MVVGNGLLAKTFKEYHESKEIVVFASGVSNSSCTNSDEYAREKQLLRKTIQEYPNKLLIYFSSCDIVNEKMSERMYYKHKLEMEEMIKQNVQTYCICRLPQIIGKSSNSATLINFLVSAIEQEKEFIVYHGTKKNLIDIRDIYKICKYTIEHKIFNKIINIVNEQYIDIEDIVKLLEEILNKKAKYKIKNIISEPKYDNTIVKNIIKNINISFDEKYLENALKYYLLEGDYR